MAKRRFKPEDLEQVGWNAVDRMLGNLNPQPAQPQQRANRYQPLIDAARRANQQRRMR